MADPTPDSDGFWSPPSRPDGGAGIEFEVPELADGGEPPALRSLTRPPSWRAASSPASALSAQYASAQRRATEVLRHATGGPDTGEEDPVEVDFEGAGA